MSEKTWYALIINHSIIYTAVLFVMAKQFRLENS